jgi:hypothetical protein
VGEGYGKVWKRITGGRNCRRTWADRCSRAPRSAAEIDASARHKDPSRDPLKYLDLLRDTRGHVTPICTLAAHTVEAANWQPDIRHPFAAPPPGPAGAPAAKYSDSRHPSGRLGERRTSGNLTSFLHQYQPVYNHHYNQKLTTFVKKAVLQLL